MKVAINKVIFCIFFMQFNSKFYSEQLNAHEYVEKAHNDIVEIIQTKVIFLKMIQTNLKMR